jgi:hypothetical protein
MVRRPLLLLALLLLGAAAVQAAVITFTERDTSQTGEVCTACGPIRE